MGAKTETETETETDKVVALVVVVAELGLATTCGNKLWPIIEQIVRKTENKDNVD